MIGCGYLGAVHAACMADVGHEVVGIDVDPERVDLLERGEPPFYEPGLPEVLTRARATGRLRFSTKMSDAAGARVHFLCVGTPQKAGENAADLTFVDEAFAELIAHVRPGDVVVGKSTVPVGTAERLSEALRTAVPGARLVWNPEFLREGFAVKDTLHPDRLVYGLDDDDTTSQAVLDEVYAAPLAEGTPLVVTDQATAQLVKVAANSFLATKISFINAMAELCEVAGGDVSALADAIGHDARIGRKFLNAGLGFGGGCLPKDIRAFMARAGELGADQTLTFLREVDSINLRRRERAAEVAREMLDGSVSGRRIAVLGAAFKPNSDDVRDSPALDVARRLHQHGAEVRVTDPQALRTAARTYGELTFVGDVEDAVAGADLVMLLTEWPLYLGLDPARVAGLVAEPRIFDGRNALDPQAWRGAGWTYRGLGRS
ncbi:UDPglucose 6-dehydrogenase [Mumia flava]|uniref:UDP-glucose 6-dehydrogenase n=1 Tax=Mumia flava TaxID=1348852 RepID=A0A2M9BJM6_9ACTN|nr:UDPglucose 6-dehydrogenase [Mumia flava]